MSKPKPGAAVSKAKAAPSNIERSKQDVSDKINPQKKAALYRKICADCGHKWNEHYKGFCQGDRPYTCFCSGFRRVDGDTL